VRFKISRHAEIEMERRSISRGALEAFCKIPSKSFTDGAEPRCISRKSISVVGCFWCGPLCTRWRTHPLW
jgi:hypothetical protein